MRANDTATRTLVTGTLVAGILAGGVAGCSLFQPTPAPDETARTLAHGIATGQFGDVPLQGKDAGRAGDIVTKAYAGMGDLRPNVEVAGVTRGNDETKATATLRVSWTLAQGVPAWTYQSTAAMTLADRTWKVTWDPGLLAPELTADEGLVFKRTWPRRADIVDRAGQPLITEREVVLVGIDKTKVPAASAAASATALAGIVKIDPAGYAGKVTAAGPQAFVQAIMLRSDDPLLAASSAAIAAVPGAVSLPRLMPLGPSKTFAQPILGVVGEASAEQVAASEGTLRAGDQAGQSGLEALYDTRLRGTPGTSVQAVERDAGGNYRGARELHADLPRGVPALATTLDSGAQSAAEAALAGVGMPAALVAVKASTGEVLAAAISPATNNQNLALAGKQAPGSTFKIVSSLATVRKTGGNASLPLACTPTITVGGRTFKNYNDYPANRLGTIPLFTALAFSCNTAFISQHDTVTQDDLIAAAQALGVAGQPTLGFANFMGSVPATDNVVEHAATFIGQGRVEMSPLALATIVASVIKGERISPVLVPEAKQQNPAPAAPLTGAEAGILREALSHVVSEGSGHRLQAVGVQYAKTGTAEYGTEVPPKTHAWMVAGRGDLAIACFVQDGASGTTSAGPLIADFLTRIGGAY